MIPSNNKIGLITNAKDYASGAAPGVQMNQINDVKHHIKSLNELGFKTESLDLKNYFGKAGELEQKLNELGALWVTGGNTFVLRQAMRLSGFDRIFGKLQDREDFLYGGYSAGICVLSGTLRPLAQVDDPYDFPYAQIKEPIWQGLGVFHYAFIPHYGSDYFGPEKIAKQIQTCIDNKWLFKALRDGDVIIIEKTGVNLISSKYTSK